jgi:DNA-binding NarL/FixJ family response regulator
LCVIDIGMPEMLGTEVARRICLAHPDAKVLYLTGQSDRLFDEKGALWGDEVFLDKPADMAALLEAVSLLLFGHTHGPSRSA